MVDHVIIGGVYGAARYNLGKLFYGIRNVFESGSLEVLWYYLIETIGFNIITIIAICLALYELFKHRNPKGKAPLVTGIIVYIIGGLLCC